MKKITNAILIFSVILVLVFIFTKMYKIQFLQKEEIDIKAETLKIEVEALKKNKETMREYARKKYTSYEALNKANELLKEKKYSYFYNSQVKELMQEYYLEFEKLGLTEISVQSDEMSFLEKIIVVEKEKRSENQNK